MQVERLILEYGAWSCPATFVRTFFEGETVVPLRIPAAWLGRCAGDQCYAASCVGLGDFCRHAVVAIAGRVAHRTSFLFLALVPSIVAGGHAVRGLHRMRRRRRLAEAAALS